MSNDNRITEYNIVVHNEDLGSDNKPIFDRLDKYLRDCFNVSTCPEIYYAYHDKDREEDGSLKTPHYHIVLRFKYNCGKSFKTMKSKYFLNSHIEQVIDFNNAVLYLTHETATAIKEGKYRYDRDVVVNVFNSDIEKYYNTIILEPFNIDKIEEYVLVDNMHSILDFGRRFGFSVITKQWSTIKEIIRELDIEEEHKRQKLVLEKLEQQKIEDFNTDLMIEQFNKGVYDNE